MRRLSREDCSKLMILMFPEVEQELTTLLPFLWHSGNPQLTTVPCHDGEASVKQMQELL